ncbi:MAG: exosortase/archaeosortase family protein, partial [Deltaproteobacteria bacterium]|nr:exosortase/archaeosortase family protein [Deltaproteobacteria bacterium]
EVVAYMGDVGSVAGLGIPLLLGAVAYAIGGVRLVRPLALPLVFLMLMVPPPQFLVYEALFRLKIFVTQASVALLRAGQFSVLAQGNQILVPDHTLFVADACSGLTSIVTMLPIACIVAYFMSRDIWRRAVVIASVVPLAIAANVLRVTLTVAFVSQLGIDVAQGLLHESFGVAVYVVGLLALVAVARLVRCV